jgi:hypothetical protein
MSYIAVLNDFLLAMAALIGALALLEHRMLTAIRAGKRLATQVAFKKN